MGTQGSILSTWNTRLNGNSIPNLHILHGRSNLHHYAGTFMAQHNGRFQDKVLKKSIQYVLSWYTGEETEQTSDFPSLPVVHIASTDSRLRDLNADIPRIFKPWNWTVLEDNVSDSTKDEGRVCFLQC